MKLAQGAINYLTNIFNLSISTGQIPEIWLKAMINPILKHGKHDSIGLNWRPRTVPSGQYAGKKPAAQNTDAHPHPSCAACPSVETLDMHSTVVDHRRHCCRLLKNKAGSQNSTRRARSDSCIRQSGPLTTARLCLQHQYIGNNPSLSSQLHAERTSQGYFLATRFLKLKCGVQKTALINYYLAEFPTPPPNIKLMNYADDNTIYTSGPVVADLINGINICLSLVLNYISK